MRNARVWNRGGTVKVRERHMKEILQISSIINWMVRKEPGDVEWTWHLQPYHTLGDNTEDWGLLS